jgi:hypothetical protein
MEQAQVTWDAFGNPIQAIDYDGTEAHVRYGPISRPMVPDSACGKRRFLCGRGSVTHGRQVSRFPGWPRPSTSAHHAPSVDENELGGHRDRRLRSAIDRTLVGEDPVHAIVRTLIHTI